MDFLKVTIREQGITSTDFVNVSKESLAKRYVLLPFSNVYIRKENIAETVVLISTNMTKRMLELIVDDIKIEG